MTLMDSDGGLRGGNDQLCEMELDLSEILNRSEIVKKKVQVNIKNTIGFVLLEMSSNYRMATEFSVKIMNGTNLPNDDGSIGKGGIMTDQLDSYV